MNKFEYPPVGFRFEVKFDDGKFGTAADASFAEVTGISAQINTEEITEGGENRFKHRLPLPLSYPPLVLKRGVANKSSKLIDWINSMQAVGIQEIKLHDIMVILLDEDHAPLMSWKFEGAYPTKYEVSGLKADSSQIALESIEFTYKRFERKD